MKNLSLGGITTLILFALFYVPISSAQISIGEETLNQLQKEIQQNLDEEEKIDVDVYTSQVKHIYSLLGGINDPDIDQLKKFLKTLPYRKMIDAETARMFFQNLSSQATNGDLSELHGPLIMLLHPFVKEAGGCIEDPENPEIEICLFSTNPTSENAHAEFVSDSFNIKPVIPAPETDLAYILGTFCPHGPDEYSSNNASSDNLTSSNCYDFDYWTTYGYKYEVKWYGTTRLWAEAFAFANLGLSTTIADTIAADIPIAFRCGYECWGDIIFNCLGKLTRGENEEALQCMLRKSSKRSYTIHGDHSYIQHAHARNCNVEQASAENRDHFKAYQTGQYDGLYEIPPEAQGFINKTDLRFQTHYQKSSSQPLMAVEGINLYPKPTSSKLSLPGLTDNMPFWKHEFSQIKGWHFNIIFNAADALINPDVLQGKRCLKLFSHPNNNQLRTYGDQFQIFHGTRADLPEFNIIVGWSSQHPAFTCTQNFLP